MKIFYKGKDFVKIEKDIIKAFNFIKISFPLEISDVVINVYDSRAEFNKKLKKETEEWLVANASHDKEIDILSPIAIENESNHHKDEFLQILKHEFTHIFIHELAKGNTIPMWLNEGLASYIADQYKDYKKAIFIEEGFCKKLDTQKGWNDNVNYSAYQISSFFVLFLINKYSFNKIKKLIVSLDKNYYYPFFKEIFFKIYKKDLSEVEKLFIKEINK